MAIVLLIGLLLRLVNLDQSLWLDEAIEVVAVKSNSYVDLVTTYAVSDFHPPLYHLILKAWTGLSGYAELAVRAPSVIFGVATVYFVYQIGKFLSPKKIALLAALFFALNPLHVYYSQEARMYALAAAAVTGAVYFFLAKKWLSYFFFLVVALSADYLPWLMLPVFLVLSRYSPKLLVASCLLPILFLPWLPVFWRQLEVGLSVAAAVPAWREVVGGFDGRAIPLTMVKFIIGRISLANKDLYALVMVPVVAVFGFAMGRARQRFLWMWLVVPIAAGFLISFIVPVFSYFRFLFVVPAFCLLLALGSWGKKWLILFVVAVEVSSLLVFNLHSRFHREDWRGFVSYVRGDRGLVVMPSLAQAGPISYYGAQLAVADKGNLRLSGDGVVYLLRYVQEIFDREDSLRKIIEESGYEKIEEKDFNGVVVWKYRR